MLFAHLSVGNKLFTRCTYNVNYLIWPLLKVKSYVRNMSNILAVENPDEDLLLPPKCVAGMKSLNKEAFMKTISVPYLKVEANKLPNLVNLIKKYSLKFSKFKPIQENGNSDFKKILINPCLIKAWPDFDEPSKKTLEQLGINSDCLGNTDLHLNFDNWSIDVILKSVLPKNDEPLTSFATVGHIIHVNIKEHLLEYKNIIGEVLLDKVANARTVVNKTNIIDNTYRNFQMEVLCGDPDLVAQARENNCIFDLDFSKVYWNSRLSTEHMRIISLLNPFDYLFDVFCGVGPFSIPAAKKKCYAYANDLNPESFKWLNHNVKLNKVAEEYIKTYNKDGADFIRDDVKNHLLQLWQDEDNINRKFHVTMNLPAMALEFVKYFNNLISINDIRNNCDFVKSHLPILHVYYFVFSQKPMEDAYQEFENGTGLRLNEDEYKLHNIRTVSNKKHMIRISFEVPFGFLVDLKHNLTDEERTDEPELKRNCV